MKRTMTTATRRFGFVITSAVLLAACVGTATAQSDHSEHEKYKYKNDALVYAELAKALRDPHTIADQAAGRRKLAPRIARWKRMARCQRQELLASAEEERIAADK